MRTTKAKCAECGIEFEKRTADYNRTERIGERHFCSRSCSVIRGNKEMSPERRIQCGEQIKKFADNRKDEFSPFREFVRRTRLKDRIKSYGKGNVDSIYLKNLWEIQDGICPYTGIKMILPQKLSNRSPKKASLDRIDSSKGYVQGNVEFVCQAINLAKNSFSKEDMKKFISEITFSITHSQPTWR
jgi:endogenous inhibitor of DNA gyrase (YacG/DUF329 family)